MTITELYEKLANKDFQDPETGNLFFPAYMYAYNPARHYKVEEEIESIRDRLHRPNNYLDILVLDIFELFLAYLQNEKFGLDQKLQFYLDQEVNDQGEVDRSLKKEAYATGFLEFIHDRIQAHHQNSGEFKVAYVFIKGFGNAFPYIRASRFMNNFEKYIQGYKLVLFYPGNVNNNYSLFGLLNDENLYRAIKLINE
jgi:DNA-dependent RNA polymerase auxiliary subunit epsilon